MTRSWFRRLVDELDDATLAQLLLRALAVRETEGGGRLKPRPKRRATMRTRRAAVPAADVAGDAVEQLVVDEADLGEQLSAAADRRGPHVAGDEQLDEGEGDDVAGDADDDDEPEDLEELVARQHARRKRVA